MREFLNISWYFSSTIYFRFFISIYLIFILSIRLLSLYLILYYSKRLTITKHQQYCNCHSIMGSSKSSPSPEDLALLTLKNQLQQKNKHLNHLKKQNHNLIKSNFTKTKPSKQYTVDDIVLMNYAAFTCIACQNPYDQNNRTPIMICKNQHTVCQPCCSQKQKLKQKSCLECSQPFQNLGKNRSILQLITNKQDLLKWVKQRDAEMEQNNKNSIVQSELAQKTIIKLCRFNQYATMFEMNGDSLHKISPQSSWHTVRSQASLPFNTQSEVSFKVVFSACNSIIVGVTIQSQEFQKGSIPSSSVAYHLNNGHIFDLQGIEFRWRAGGSALAKNSNPRVLMKVKQGEQKIKWKINGKLYGQTQLPYSFLSQPLYFFVSIYHKDDIILLNK